MNYSRLFSLNGINFWYLASAIALNLFWALGGGLLISYLFLNQGQNSAGTVQIILLVATFIGPFLIGWLIGRMAADGRGPTYGFYGSLGSVAVLLFLALSGGVVGIMLIVAALAGGLNGGMLSLRR